MGPSRECDGDSARGATSPWPSPTQTASMGPSRECDGDPAKGPERKRQGRVLQWGRRVNATETSE